MRHATDHTANNGAANQQAYTYRSSEAAEHFFVRVNQLQKKKVQDDESVWRWAQLLHAFFLREKHVSIVFFLSDHARIWYSKCRTS